MAYVRPDPDDQNAGIVADTFVFNGTRYTKATANTQISELPQTTLATIKDELTAGRLKNEIQLALTGGLGGPHEHAFKFFKSGKKKEAARLLLAAAGESPWWIDVQNVTIFNDLGYFLEQSGMYADAVRVLETVIGGFPDRTVAYLNLADAYSGLGDTAKAVSNYRTYRDKMLASGKNDKIPQRVLQQLK